MSKLHQINVGDNLDNSVAEIYKAKYERKSNIIIENFINNSKYNNNYNHILIGYESSLIKKGKQSLLLIIFKRKRRN